MDFFLAHALLHVRWLLHHDNGEWPLLVPFSHCYFTVQQLHFLIEATNKLTMFEIWLTAKQECLKPAVVRLFICCGWCWWYCWLFFLVFLSFITFSFSLHSSIASWLCWTKLPIECNDWWAEDVYIMLLPIIVCPMCCILHIRDWTLVTTPIFDIRPQK